MRLSSASVRPQAFSCWNRAKRTDRRAGACRWHDTSPGTVGLTSTRQHEVEFGQKSGGCRCCLHDERSRSPNPMMDRPRLVSTNSNQILNDSVNMQESLSLDGADLGVQARVSTRLRRSRRYREAENDEDGAVQPQEVLITQPPDAVADLSSGNGRDLVDHQAAR